MMNNREAIAASDVSSIFYFDSYVQDITFLNVVMLINSSKEFTLDNRYYISKVSFKISI